MVAGNASSTLAGVIVLLCDPWDHAVVLTLW
jgi:hypothetical protein